MRGLAQKAAARLGLRSASRRALVGAPELWEMKRRFQMAFLRGERLRAHERLLDLGCGSLRGGVPIIEYLEPGRYTGLDARQEAIEAAAEEVTDQSLWVKGPRLLYAPELHGLMLEESYHVVWCFSVLIHLDDPKLSETLAFMSRVLAPGGRVFANVNIGEVETIGSWDGFPVVRRPLEFYRGAAAEHGLVVRDLGALRELGHHSGDQQQDGQHMLLWRHASTAASGPGFDGSEVEGSLPAVDRQEQE